MAVGLSFGAKNSSEQKKKTAKENIMPNFLSRREDDANAEEKAERSKNAASNFESAERNASDADVGSGSNVETVRQNEEEASGLFSGSGRGDGDEKSKRKFGFFVRKRGGIIAIIMMIFGFGGIMGATQSFLPTSLIAQFKEHFNTMQTSARYRSDAFFKYQMGTKRYQDPIRRSWNIFSGDTFKLTKKQRTKLAAQGITYDDDYDGKGTRVLKFDDGSGEIKIVTADAKTANKIGNGAVDFKTLYEANTDFFNGYNKGSLTWRGAIANWFGTMTVKFLQSNNITRNMFKDFQEKVAAANNGNTRAVAQEIMAKNSEEVEDGGMKVIGAQEAGQDSEGNKIYNPSDNTSPGETMKRSDYVGTNATADTTIRAKLDDIGGKVQKGANVACTVLNTVGGITLLVTAFEAKQIIDLTSAYFETYDKVMAGRGDEAPVHALTNALTQSTINEDAILVYKEGISREENEQNVTNDGIKSIETEYVKTNKSAMQSSGIISMFSNDRVNPYDPNVQSFNPSLAISTVLGGVGASMEAFTGCALAKVAANAVTATIDAIKVASCIAGLFGAAFTFGATSAGCAPLITGVIKGIGISVALGVAVSAVISTLTPVVANMLKRDLIAQLGGEALGNALTSGSNMFMGNTHRSNGGSLSDYSSFERFAMAQQQVIAENAKYERQTRSPFDVTSKYTFMGSLLTQMMSFLTVNSLMSAISSTSSVVSSSIVALTPSANAYDISSVLPDPAEYEKTCPYLASIGAVGDAFCNPYAITDVTTLEYDPSEVISHLADQGNFSTETQDTKTADGEIKNVKIDKNSDLAKYILFCDERVSTFGIADQNIVNAVTNWGNVNTGNSTADAAINSAIGAVPVIGDVIDVVSNSIGLRNIGYVGGESCVAGHSFDGTSENGDYAADSPSWSKAKWYQRFIEDQALAESMGIIDESAVTAFLDEYYEENPLDNSYEGILARYSGLSKDNVVALLDFIEYSDYIANYHPEERFAFGQPRVKLDKGLIIENDNNEIIGKIILLNQISFADVRNRSFAV